MAQQLKTMSSLLKSILIITIIALGGWIAFSWLGINIEIEKAEPIEPEVVVELGGEWVQVDEVADVWRMEWFFEPAETARLIIYRLPVDKFSLSFSHGEAKKVTEWAEDDGVVLAINGTYFHEDLLPSGMLITRGEKIGEREFDLDKTGLITLQPELAILDTATESFDRIKLVEAGQSYPFLIKNGLPAVKEDSGLTARRSFIGLDNNDQIYIGIVPNRTVSMYQISQILSKIEVDWDDVINLDGGPSSGIYSNFSQVQETIDSFTPVPNVLMIKRLGVDKVDEIVLD